MCPLDWGLGHATRCVPLIESLLDKGHDVKIASSGAALVLLKEEFPQLQFFELPSYRAHYSRSRYLMLSIFRQMPKFLRTIFKEHRQINAIIKQQNIQYLISDNRYGCWSDRIHTAIITHQVNIQMPTAWKWLQPVVNFFNHRQLKKFNQIWVPDFADNRITGAMTAPGRLKVIFVGMLSRFKADQPTESEQEGVLALVSGPEPQRTLFERLLISEFGKIAGKKTLVRGLPGSSESQTDSTIEIINHASAKKLNEMMRKAAVIICRPGYSTIMDLAALRAKTKVVCVATPGQTEQELLARELDRRNIAPALSQSNFNIAAAHEKSKAYLGFEGWQMQPILLTTAIDNFLT